MINEELKRIKAVLDKKLQDKKEAQDKQEQLGWFSILLDNAVDRFTQALSKLQIKSPEVTVNVPEVKVPEIKVPDIKSPDIHIPEIKLPTIVIPEIKVPDIIVPKAEVEVKIPKIKIPTPRVTVNVPSFPKIPDLKWPEEEMPIKGWVGLMGVGPANPLPVEIRDKDGKPVNLLEGLSQITVGGGARIMKIGGINDSAWGTLITPDGRLKTEAAGSGGLTDTELRASAVPVIQVTGSVDSVNIISPVAQGDAATALRVVIAGNSDASVTATQTGTWNVTVNTALPVGGNNIGDVDVLTFPTAFNQGDTEGRTLRVVIAGDSITSVKATANSGVDIGDVDITSIAAGDNNIGNVDVVTLPSLVAGAANIGDVDVLTLPALVAGTANIGNVNVNGTLNSVIAVGPVLHDAVDDGAAPQKVGGTAITANPTAVAGGDVVRFVADKIGRQLVTPYQVRDLIVTARAAPTNVAPTILLAGGGAGVFHDLISVTASNDSTAANTAVGAWITFNILEVQSGGPVLTFTVGNGDTITFHPPAPIRQSEGGSAWMVDITSDASTLAAAPLVVSALFAKNV